MTCETCRKWTGEHNAAVANGLILKARAIGRRITAHERSAHA